MKNYVLKCQFHEISPQSTRVKPKSLKVAPETTAKYFFYPDSISSRQVDDIYLHKTNGICIHELFQRGEKQERETMSNSSLDLQHLIMIMMTIIFTIRLPCARHCCKSFTYIILFNLHNTQSCEVRTTVISFYR